MANENTNIEVFDIAEEAVEAYENQTNANGKKNVKLMVGLTIATAGGIFLIRKGKGILEKWHVKSLQKKGYAIYKPEEENEDEDYEVVEIKK